MKINTLIFVLASSIAGLSFAQTPASAPAASSASVTNVKAVASVPKTAASAATSAMAEAAGGGPDKVWINSKSNTYHCPGTKYYGKTKAGEYMTEADAKTKGAHAVNGKACGKKI